MTGQKRTIDWGDLRYFVELARNGSLSATARALNVDHSTVGRRIAALEDSLGARLFDRQPRGYVLTAEGEAVAQLAMPLEEAVLDIERRVQGCDARLGGLVRVTATESIATHLLAPAFAEFRRRHPGITLELLADNRNLSLTRREADIALRLARPEAAAGLVTRRIGAVGYGLYCAAGYRGEDYLGYDAALSDVAQERWLREHLAGREPVFRTNTLPVLLAAVKAGMGRAVLPRFLALPDLIELLPPDRVVSRDVWLVVHDDLRHTARVRAVMDFLTEVIGQL